MSGSDRRGSTAAKTSGSLSSKRPSPATAARRGSETRPPTRSSSGLEPRPRPAPAEPEPRRRRAAAASRRRTKSANGSDTVAARQRACSRTGAGAGPPGAHAVDVPGQSGMQQRGDGREDVDGANVGVVDAAAALPGRLDEERDARDLLGVSGRDGAVRRARREARAVVGHHDDERAVVDPRRLQPVRWRGRAGGRRSRPAAGSAPGPRRRAPRPAAPARRARTVLEPGHLVHGLRIRPPVGHAVVRVVRQLDVQERQRRLGRAPAEAADERVELLRGAARAKNAPPALDPLALRVPAAVLADAAAPPPKVAEAAVDRAPGRGAGRPEAAGAGRRRRDPCAGRAAASEPAAAPPSRQGTGDGGRCPSRAR